MKVIHAIFENGVFRPTEPVDLPEGSPVTVEPNPPPTDAARISTHQQRIYELLSHPHDTGDPGLSERHNEHQP